MCDRGSALGLRQVCLGAHRPAPRECLTARRTCLASERQAARRMTLALSGEKPASRRRQLSPARQGPTPKLSNTQVADFSVRLEAPPVANAQRGEEPAASSAIARPFQATDTCGSGWVLVV